MIPGLLLVAALAMPPQSFEVAPPERTVSSPSTVQPTQPVITASFSSQGAEALKAMVGKKVRGVGLTSVTVCSASPAKFASGLIWQSAVSHGISPIDPDIATAMINRKVAWSLYTVIPHLFTDGAGGLAALGAGRVISMSSPWLVGLVALSATTNIVMGQIASHKPDPSVLFKNLLDPTGTMVFDGASCKRAMLVTRYKGKKTEQADGVYTIQ